MEAADATVSIDVLLKALFALGAKPKDVAAAIRKRATNGKPGFRQGWPDGKEVTTYHRFSPRRRASAPN
jgi:hypothetical protein